MNKGYQVTFFTQQDRTHQQLPLAQWLVDAARKLGLSGATLNGSIEGLGHDGKIHMINMYDFADQPLQIVMVVNEEEYKRLFELLEHEQVAVFYTVVAVEYGTSGA